MTRTKLKLWDTIKTLDLYAKPVTLTFKGNKYYIIRLMLSGISKQD